MPEITDDEIRQQVASGRISLLSIDTNIFDRYKHGLESGLLRRLSQFIDTEVGFVLSEIVLRELRTHMIKNAEEARTQLESALQRLERTRYISSDDRDSTLNSLVGERPPSRIVDERLASFQRITGFVVVEVAPRVAMNDLLERYFDVEAPFGHKKEKKHEFPDAMSLLALENYAEEQGKLMLLVSEYLAWKQFASDSQHLICVADLGITLSYFQTLTLVVCARLAERLRRGELSELEEEIQHAVATFAEGMPLYVEASSSYFYEHDIPEVEIFRFDTKTNPYSCRSNRMMICMFLS